MIFKEILTRLDALEERLTQGTKDNMKIQQIHLKLFSDGSGMVDADWSKCTEGMCDEERLLNTIFSEESPLFEFTNIDELKVWLKSMTPDTIIKEGKEKKDEGTDVQGGGS